MEIRLSGQGDFIQIFDDGRGYLECPCRRRPRKNAKTIELGTVHPNLCGRVIWTEFVFNNFDKTLCLSFYWTKPVRIVL